MYPHERSLVKRLENKPFALLGITLSIYLGFRNDAAYDRWWEARKLWGQLIYEMRSFARETAALLPPEARRKRTPTAEELARTYPGGRPEGRTDERERRPGQD